MKKLKEYAGVIVAMVTVMTALASLGLWAIHVQIKPEIRRLDGRIELLTHRIEAGFNRKDGRIESLTDRVDRLDARWESRFNRIEARFNRIEGDIKTIENDIKTILLRLPKRQETG